ncbi:YjbQ family protein [Candidatus Woesebacteria bacterium]|nr:YjbQ family protein [Candidatus Woesebacteria bacterium]
MQKLIIKTLKEEEIVDLTDKINELLKKENIKQGICHLFAVHTTCSLTTLDLDPGTDLDFFFFFLKIFPSMSYRHSHDPSHVGDHIISSIIGPSVTIPIEEGQLVLGTWQRVVLVELSGPREREIILQIFQEK